VLQLYVQRGPFWEAVQQLRLRRGIEPSTHIPSIHMLLWLSPPSFDKQHDNIRTEDQRKEWEEADMRWRDDLLTIILRVVPERFRARHSLNSPFDWYGFISACVLHDPPKTDLRKFSEIGGPWASSLWLQSTKDHNNTYVTVGSPIRWFADPDEIRRIEIECWTAGLDKLDDLHLQHLGLNLADMIEDVHRKFPEIRRVRAEKLHYLNKRRYIEVDEHTTEDEVRKAFRMLAEAHRTRPEAARPKRNRLLCVECAVLHDRYTWTYEQLAERYGWHDHTLASKYIRDGRSILKV
jgi:hypothetical protein